MHVSLSIFLPQQVTTSQDLQDWSPHTPASPTTAPGHASGLLPAIDGGRSSSKGQVHRFGPQLPHVNRQGDYPVTHPPPHHWGDPPAAGTVTGQDNHWPAHQHNQCGHQGPETRVSEESCGQRRQVGPAKSTGQQYSHSPAGQHHLSGQHPSLQSVKGQGRYHHNSHAVPRPVVRHHNQLATRQQSQFSQQSPTLPVTRDSRHEHGHVVPSHQKTSHSPTHPHRSSQQPRVEYVIRKGTHHRHQVPHGPTLQQYDHSHQHHFASRALLEQVIGQDSSPPYHVTHGLVSQQYDHSHQRHHFAPLEQVPEQDSHPNPVVHGPTAQQYSHLDTHLQHRFAHQPHTVQVTGQDSHHQTHYLDHLAPNLAEQYTPSPVNHHHSGLSHPPAARPAGSESGHSQPYQRPQPAPSPSVQHLIQQHHHPHHQQHSQPGQHVPTHQTTREDRIPTQHPRSRPASHRPPLHISQSPTPQQSDNGHTHHRADFTQQSQQLKPQIYQGIQTIEQGKTFIVNGLLSEGNRQSVPTSTKQTFQNEPKLSVSWQPPVKNSDTNFTRGKESSSVQTQITHSKQLHVRKPVTGNHQTFHASPWVEKSPDRQLTLRSLHHTAGSTSDYVSDTNSHRSRQENVPHSDIRVYGAHKPSNQFTNTSNNNQTPSSTDHSQNPGQHHLDVQRMALPFATDFANRSHLIQQIQFKQKHRATSSPFLEQDSSKPEVFQASYSPKDTTSFQPSQEDPYLAYINRPGQNKRFQTLPAQHRMTMTDYSKANSKAAFLNQSRLDAYKTKGYGGDVRSSPYNGAYHDGLSDPFSKLTVTQPNGYTHDPNRIEGNTLPPYLRHGSMTDDDKMNETEKDENQSEEMTEREIKRRLAQLGQMDVGQEETEEAEVMSEEEIEIRLEQLRQLHDQQVEQDQRQDSHKDVRDVDALVERALKGNPLSRDSEGVNSTDTDSATPTNSHGQQPSKPPPSHDKLYYPPSPHHVTQQPSSEPAYSRNVSPGSEDQHRAQSQQYLRLVHDSYDPNYDSGHNGSTDDPGITFDRYARRATRASVLNKAEQLLHTRKQSKLESISELKKDPSAGKLRRKPPQHPAGRRKVAFTEDEEGSADSDLSKDDDFQASAKLFQKGGSMGRGQRTAVKNNHLQQLNARIKKRSLTNPGSVPVRKLPQQKKVARGRVVRDDFEEFSSASEEEEDVIRYGPAAIDDLARYDMGRGVFRPLFLERFPEEDQQEPVARTARRVWFLLNGHANVKPMQRLISQKNYPNFERLLIDLSEKFPCAKSIKYIFRWPDRKEIKSVTEFENGCYYVCSRSKRVVSANYGNSKEQYWKGGKPRHQENFLFTDRDIGQVSSPQGHQMPKVVTVVSNVNRDSKASQRHTKQSRGLAPFPGGDFSPNRRYPLNRTGEPVRCDINGRKREFFGPSSGLHADADGKRPYKKFRLNWVYGYRGRDVRQNLVVLPETEELVYFVDSVVVLYDRDKHAQRYYMGHTDEITCLAIHPQEPHIASGQMAGKTPEGAAHVRVWNALHLTIISVLGIGAFQRGVSCVSFSERQYLLLAIDNSDHHVMSLWNCAEDQDRPLAQTKLTPYGRIPTYNYKTTQELVVYGCFFPLDESILVTLGKQHLYFWKVFMDRPDGPIRRDTKSGIFELQKFGRTSELMKETPKFVTSVCFSPAGEVITGDSKGSVTVWSADNEDVFQIDQDASEPMTYAHKKSVSTLVMLSDRVLLSGGGNEIKAWDTRRGFLLIIARQLPQVHGAVRKIIPLFNSGMDALLLVGTVRNVILEGSLRSKFAVLVQGHSEELRAVKAHPVERSFFTAGHDKTLIKWSTHTHHPSWIATATAPCSSMSVDSRGVMVAVGMVTGELALYRGADGGQWKTLRVSKAQVNALAFSPDGQQLAAGCEDGFVYVCTIQDDKSIHRLRSAQLRHGTFVKALDWSTDGRYLQTVMGDYDVVFWDVKNMQKVQTMTYLRDVFWHTHSSPVGYPLVGPWRKLKRGEVITTACRSTDLDLVVTGDNVGRVRLFKYPSTALQPDCQQAKPFSCRVTAAEFVHKDCGVVVAGGSDAVLMQYDLDDR